MQLSQCLHEFFTCKFYWPDQYLFENLFNIVYYNLPSLFFLLADFTTLLEVLINFKFQIHIAHLKLYIEPQGWRPNTIIYLFDTWLETDYQQNLKSWMTDLQWKTLIIHPMSPLIQHQNKKYSIKKIQKSFFWPG